MDFFCQKILNFIANSFSLQNFLLNDDNKSVLLEIKFSIFYIKFDFV